MDLKERYQIKANELAEEIYYKEFDRLTDVIQEIVYEKAIEMVGEELQEEADTTRKELQLEGLPIEMKKQLIFKIGKAKTTIEVQVGKHEPSPIGELTNFRDTDIMLHCLTIFYEHYKDWLLDN